MLDILPQLPAALWLAIIVFIFIVATLIYARRRRFRLKEVVLAAGPFQAKLGPPESPPPASEPPAIQPAVDISHNTMIGSNTVRVLRDNVRITFNRLLGRQQIDVGDPSASQPKRLR